MSTDKLRVQAYLHSDIYYQFDKERMTLGLTQSQALEKILIERYDVANKTENPKPESLDWIRSAFEDLQERVSKLELDSELFGESFSESVSDTSNEILSQIIGEINHEVRVRQLEGEPESELEGEPEGELFSELDSTILSPFVIYSFDLQTGKYYYWEGLGKKKEALTIACTTLVNTNLLAL